MKIAVFGEIYTPHIGGCVSIASDLMDSLMAEGNEVLIVASSPKVSGFVLEDNVLLCPAVKYNNTYGFAFNKSKLSDLLTYIKNFRPDVIHINSISPIGISALEIANQLNIPSVFYINEEIKNNSLLGSVKAKNFFKKLVAGCDVLSGAAPITQQYVDDCKLDRKVLVCPPAINTEFFDCNKILPVKSSKIKDFFNLQDTQFIAAFCGFLTDDNGLDELFNAWAKNISIDDNIKLIVIGDGPAKSHLMSLAQDISIQKQIVFTGAVRRDRIPGLFSICDVFVSGNSNDIASIAMLEALSCGLPAIIPATSPNLFQLKEGVTGFSYRDSDDMIKYLKRFSGLDEDGRKILKNLVRKNALENKATRYAKRMLALYSRAVELHSSVIDKNVEEAISDIDVFTEEMTDIYDFRD